MKCLLCSLICLIATFTIASGQSFPTYHSTTDLSFTSPGAVRFGLYGYENPALLTYAIQPDFAFVWTHDATGSWNDFNRWGLFSASHNVGVGVVKTKMGGLSITDYRLSLSFGDRALGFGMAYGFTGGDKAAFNRSNVFTIGTAFRPGTHLSAGLVGSVATAGGMTEAAVDLALRPTGSESFTLFADYAIQSSQKLKDGSWCYGASIEPLAGIRVAGRYFDSHALSIGLSLSLGSVGVSAQSTWDEHSHHSMNTYAIRLGALERTAIAVRPRDENYAEMDLRGGMKYQRFLLFDNAQTLKNTLDAIATAKGDGSISGIAINTSGMTINREMLWELREQLRDFKSAGKKVVVFVDRPTMEEYRFATVADRIVMDPTGLILLPGYLMGNTFFKGTLEKLGLGYDEWRFFKYKSAFEHFSRDSMSAADREQKQKYIDNLYAQTRYDICQGRGFSEEQFDHMVNDEVLFLAKDAIEKGLVDTIGRWDAIPAVIAGFEGKKKPLVKTSSLRNPVTARWGEPPHIALIYARGICAMDEGINARSLAKDVEAAGKDPDVKAIVLRVDSPGGDGMASDYVAEALKRAKNNKPVIVSQGMVAASGGYWLSMYADTIIAAPATITGSIGVIGGWIYNRGLKETLGMATDHVQAGAHADLGFGFTLPLLGLTLPDRNLTEVERRAAQRALTTYYDDFVKKVAAGRQTTTAAIDAIAQGRFYSGIEGKNVGLVDLLGGLDDALRIARHKAGIAPDGEVTIDELPKPGLFNLSGFVPRVFGIEDAINADPLIQQLKFRLQFNGQPMPLMPLGAIPPNE